MSKSKDDHLFLLQHKLSMPPIPPRAGGGQGRRLALLREETTPRDTQNPQGSHTPAAKSWPPPCFWSCGTGKGQRDRQRERQQRACGVAASREKQPLCKSEAQARGSLEIKVPLLPAAKLGDSFRLNSLKTGSSEHPFLRVGSGFTGWQWAAQPTRSWKRGCRELFLRAMPDLPCQLSLAMDFGRPCYAGVKETLLSFLHCISTPLECSLIGIGKLYFSWSVIRSPTLYLSHWFSPLPHGGLCGEWGCCTGTALSCKKWGAAVKREVLPAPPLPCIFHVRLCAPVSTRAPGQPQEAGPADNGSSEKWRNVFWVQVSSQPGPEKANGAGETSVGKLHAAGGWARPCSPPGHCSGVKDLAQRGGVHCIRACLVLRNRGQDLSATRASSQCVLELAGTAQEATRKPGNSRLLWWGYVGMRWGGRREPRGEQCSWALPPTLVTEEECQKGWRRKRCSCFLSRRKASIHHLTRCVTMYSLLAPQHCLVFSTPRPLVWGWKLPSEIPCMS